MLSKQDLQDRVRRLEQLVGGLNAELVRLAMGAEPMLECEVRTYLEALQEMATSAKVAASALQTAVARIGREEERARDRISLRTGVCFDMPTKGSQRAGRSSGFLARL